MKMNYSLSLILRLWFILIRNCSLSSIFSSYYQIDPQKKISNIKSGILFNRNPLWFSWRERRRYYAEVVGSSPTAATKGQYWATKT